MSTALFSLLEKVLQPKEHLRFTISKQPDGRLVLLSQPLTGKKGAPEDIPKEAEQIRAALALPLRLVGDGVALDMAFEEHIRGYGEAREELNASYRTLLGVIKEATKDAKNKTATAGKSSVSKPTGAATTTTAAPVAASSTNQADTSVEEGRSDAAPVSDKAPAPSKDTSMQQPLSLL